MDDQPIDPLRLESLVAQCLDRVVHDGLDAIEQVCADHPSIADAIRERVRSAIDLGLISAATPRRIGRYEILRPLGKGGMGEVFLARETEPVKRLVAIKRSRERVLEQQLRLRFEAEAQALALLDHAGVAKVFEVHKDESGHPFFAMEYVDGEPVTEFADERRLTIRERVRLLASVCDAIQHAHQNGIIHRDLKPSNILAFRSGEDLLTKVIDFGLVKPIELELTDESLQTNQGQILGTPEYMSPEQASIQHNQIDTRTDIYSLGVVLYELLVGSLPFESARLRESGPLEMLRILKEDLPETPTKRLARLSESLESIAASRSMTAHALASTLRGELEWIFLKATDKDRDRRYATAAEFAADLRRYLEARPVEAAPPSRLYPLRKFVARNRTTVGLSSLVAVLLIASLIVIANLFREAQQNLSGFLRLDQARDGQLLAARVHELWPLDETRGTALRSWIANHDQWLAETDGVDVELENLQDLDAEPDSFEARLRDSLLVACDQLRSVRRELPRDAGWRALIEQRMDFAESYRRSSITTFSSEWQHALRRIRQTHGRDLEPIPGLVPLGPDPTWGVEEFAMIEPGVPIPERTGAGLRFPTGPRALVFVFLPGGHALLGAQPFREDWPRYDPSAPRSASRPGSENEASMAHADWLEFGATVDAPLVHCDLDPFLISKYEVTEQQFWRVMHTDPEVPRRGEDLPVNHVSHLAAQEYCRRLGIDLPSRIQHSYAAFGGRDAIYWWGTGRKDLGEHANVLDETCAMASTAMAARRIPGVDDGFADRAPVGSFRSNPFGLHDAIGNVWEMTGAPLLQHWNMDLDHVDGRGFFQPVEAWKDAVDPNVTVSVGGSCYGSEAHCKPYAENRESVTTVKATLGLRPVRNLPQ